MNQAGRKRLAALLLAVGCAPGAALGSPEGHSGTLSFVLENDIFYERDRHYTNGLGLNWVPGTDVAVPPWALAIARHAPGLGEAHRVRHAYAFGQSIFTPSDTRLAEPDDSDRPYAGWLYGMIGLSMATAARQDMLWLGAGIVGPASLAEDGQKLVHELTGGSRPRGWRTQLDNEPGLVVGWQRTWREFASTTLIGAELDLAPHVGATLGNIYTYASAGMTARYGRRLPPDYGAPRIQPGLPGFVDFARPRRSGWYFFGGVEGRAVARNIFLDGNTFRSSRSVDKHRLVHDLQFGIAADWPSFRLSYTHVLRSREFRTQDRPDRFGSLNMSLRF